MTAATVELRSVQLQFPGKHPASSNKALPNESSDAKFATVGAVYDRPYFVESRKNGRS